MDSSLSWNEKLKYFRIRKRKVVKLYLKFNFLLKLAYSTVGTPDYIAPEVFT